MKKFLTLVAAAFMAVGVNAQTEDVIKVSSGNPEWGQMFVNDGVKFEWPGRTFESTEKLTANAVYAGCNLKDSEGNDLTYARESGSVQTYTIEFGATPNVKLQINVNCIIKNEWGGHSTMISKPLTIEGNKASFTVSKEDCSFSGWSYIEEWDSMKDKLILKPQTEYTDDPQDVTSLVLQACDANATYPAVINIKSIKRVTTTATDIPRYTFDLANVDFSASDAKKIGGWGGDIKTDIKDGVEVITFTKQNQAHEVQVDFENVYPKGAKIRLTMEAKGSVAGSITAVLQNPDNYNACSKYENITLPTDQFQPIEKTFICSGDNARRLLLNVGTYDGTIYIKSVKIEALEVPQETVTISPSGYSTYAAYYPVDYSKLDDLKAYTVKLNAEKTGIVMNEVVGVVPAGVAVLLKGKADTDYALTKAEGWQNVTSDLKMSDGTITSTDKTAVYGLATVGGQDGFYKASNDKTIPAKCAYLEVKNSANPAKFYSLGDHSGSTTGITSVKNEAAGNNAPMYNLAGQLVDKGYKGIVIKNGKKIVLK